MSYRCRKAFPRKDANHKAIVDALKKVPGITVLTLTDGPDICVGYQSRNYLFEIKRDTKAKFKPSQIKFFTEWQGQVSRIESADEVFALLGLIVGVSGNVIGAIG